jgi:hypothetical protein
MRKHRRPTTFRQLVPPLFYGAVISLFLVGLWAHRPVVAFALPAVYATALLACAIALVPRVGVHVAFRVPVAIGAMHAGYAMGLMYGLWAALFRREAWSCRGPMATLTR